MTLRQRYESLLLFDPHRSPATANIWVSHPSPSEEQVLGKLVVVSSISGSDRTNLEVISLIQEELRTAYYQSVDVKPKAAFEHALNEVNARVHQVIADGVNTWVHGANILMAAVWRDTLIMTSVGTMHVFLLRRTTKDGRTSQSIHDINNGDSATPNPVRLFSHTVSGQLVADDQILVCTPSLLDYFSLEKLRRTMLDGNPSAAVHQWETTLLGVEQQAAFAAIIIQSLAVENIIAPISRPVAQATPLQSAPQASMSTLIAQEQATERLLSPSIWPAIRDAGSQIFQALGRLIRKVILRKPPKRIVPSYVAHLETAHQQPASWWLATRRRLSIGLAWILSAGRALIPRRVRLPNAAPAVSMPPVIRRRWRPTLNGLVHWFQQLSQQQRWLAIAGVALVLVLAIILVPKHTAPIATTTSSIDSINDHLTKAKAALLYGGEDTASKEVAQAKTEIESLPNRSTKDKQAKTTVTAALNEILTTLAKRTVIDTPSVVVSFTAVAPTANLRRLYMVNGVVVAVDPDTSTVVRSTITNPAPSVIANTLDTGHPTSGTVSGASTILFATDRNGFVELDTTKNVWKPFDSAWPETQPTIASIAVYQNRVYALDTAHNAFVRFSRAAKTFGTGTLWLKESATLSSARSIAVDGAIYCLQSNGMIESYTNNRKSSFSAAPIEPPLQGATQLWTDANSSKLYITDPKEHRIVVMNKSGKLLNQYTSSAWNDLRDVAINEKTKTAYVLSGSTVTSFTLLQ